MDNLAHGESRRPPLSTAASLNALPAAFTRIFIDGSLLHRPASGPGQRLMKSDDIKEARKKAALDYHEFPTPGKLSILAHDGSEIMRE